MRVHIVARLGLSASMLRGGFQTVIITIICAPYPALKQSPFAEQVAAPPRDARTLAKEARSRRKETAGRGWFDLPATQITDEVRRCLFGTVLVVYAVVCDKDGGARGARSFQRRPQPQLEVYAAPVNTAPARTSSGLSSCSAAVAACPGHSEPVAWLTSQHSHSFPFPRFT